MYDSIIIGKGPAGISASLYIQRANLNSLIIGKDGGSLGRTPIIENYYGFEEPIKGKELIEKGEKQAKRLGSEILDEEVLKIEYEGIFKVYTKNNMYKGKTVLLATGVNRNVPNIKGIKEYEGKGVSYCAICDAFFYKGKNVAVLGSGDYAINEIKDLQPVVNSVIMITNGKEPVQDRDIEINEVTKKIREFRGDNKLREIEFEDNTVIQIDGIFVAEGSASSTDFARKMGVLLDGKNIIVNDNMQTNIKGLFAAGDCTGGLLQVSKAVYEGAKAGLGIIKFLRENRKGD